MITTSKLGIRRWISACPSGRARSTVRLRLPRLSDWKYFPSLGTTAPLLRRASPASGSTLITSAPMSESWMPTIGPATIWENSRTRMPASAPASPEAGACGGAPRPPVASRAPISAPRQAQATGGDDAALDLGGAAADRGRDCPQVHLCGGGLV